MQVRTRTFAFFAAAIAATLSAGASFSRASGVPYSTSFESTPDAQGDSYTTTSLVGQNGWISEVGETGSATVVNSNAYSGTQAVQLTEPGTQANGGTFEDFYNANVADHPGYNGGAAGGYTGTGSALSIAPNNTLNISFAMNTNLGTSGDLAGAEVFDSHDDLIASLFVGHAPGGPVLYTSNGTNGQEDVNTASGFPSDSFGGADGSYGSYSITINPSADNYTISYGGQTYTAALPSDYSGAIGGITFSMYDAGNSAASANFDNLSVSTAVPEPASISMIAMGALLALGKRRKYPIA